MKQLLVILLWLQGTMAFASRIPPGPPPPYKSPPPERVDIIAVVKVMSFPLGVDVPFRAKVFVNEGIKGVKPGDVFVVDGRAFQRSGTVCFALLGRPSGQLRY